MGNHSPHHYFKNYLGYIKTELFLILQYRIKFQFKRDTERKQGEQKKQSMCHGWPLLLDRSYKMYRNNNDRYGTEIFPAVVVFQNIKPTKFHLPRYLNL